jgi:hypothetical protein
MTIKFKANAKIYISTGLVQYDSKDDFTPVVIVDNTYIVALRDIVEIIE